MKILGGAKPRGAAGRRLKAAGKVIRIQAGDNGSIQGPCEAKWGYTTLSVADWDHDGLPDVLVNSIWGEVLWYRNMGSRTRRAWPPLGLRGRLAKPPPQAQWCWWNPRGRQLVTQWRTTPVAVDFTGDRLVDLVMLDHEGYLALFERRRTGGKLELLPPRRIFVDEDNRPIQLNPGIAGKSGRRKIASPTGRRRAARLLVDSVNADWWRNCETRAAILSSTRGALGNGSWHRTDQPCVVDWDGNGKPDCCWARRTVFSTTCRRRGLAYSSKAKTARPAHKSK
ncbi:MAG: hypothetical protein CM1200mP29_03400 [Verrucomicrobiota bacterium]|nr:MAG: hypothetical protein CM1200mP29_03400 [Verrucomicrobiota bacterium]